jgi:hypothetical protein
MTLRGRKLFDASENYVASYLCTELARAVPCRLVKNYVASYLCTELARAVHKCFFLFVSSFWSFKHVSLKFLKGRFLPPD